MKNKAFPISMTVLWGMVFSSAMHSMTMGICMGLMMGIAFGLLDSDKRDPESILCAYPGKRHVHR